MAKAPFSNVDLQRLQRSYLFGPRYFVDCSRGHSVHPSLSAWKLKTDKRGWYVQVECRHTEWRKGELETAGYHTKCRGHARIDLPEDPTCAA